MDLRKEFFDIMIDIADKDKDVVVIVGDVGYSKMEDFQYAHPEQFINIGCMEQSMVSIAAGMALGGKKPFVYTNSIFLLARAYEQIRNDVCYNKLPVKLIGTGAAGFLGFSHNWQGKENEEDLLKNLPYIKYVRPEDKNELKKALKSKGAKFIRV